MADTLLLLQPNHDSRRALAAAIEHVRQHSGVLHVVGTIDPETLSRMSATLAEEGFLGEKVSDQFCGVLAGEYRTRAEESVREAVEEARNAGIDADGEAREGEPGELCRALVREHRIDTVFLAAERRSWLTRFLARTGVNLPNLTGCEIRVIEED